MLKSNTMWYFKATCSRLWIVCNKSCHRVYSKEVRVRFAPSPTGFLHLGGLRTAFYNYLFARKNGGKFILRIEDTDQKRVKEGAVENLNHVLEWAGLTPDESPLVGGPFGPYMQSQRLELYSERADLLVKSGQAYRCFCSEARLELMRKHALQNRLNPGYDNKCRHLTTSEIQKFTEEGKPFTIRFKITQGPMSFKDAVYGDQTLDISGSEGDFIIVKSDGYPTYHFACVVDDHSMEISHVLRGYEWLLSTTKHLMLHRAFQWTPPTFAHLPLLVNSNRKKLSKREESSGVEYYKKLGYSPDVLLNFLAAAGGGFGTWKDREVQKMDALASKFDLGEVNTHFCVVDTKILEEFSHDELLRKISDDQSIIGIIEKLRSLLKDKFGESYDLEEKHITDDFIRRILKLYKDRISNLSDLLVPDMHYLWSSCNTDVILNHVSKLKDIEVVSCLPKVIACLVSIKDEEFNQDAITQKLKDLCSDENIPYIPLMRMMRIVLTAKKDGPGVSEILCTLGRDRSLRKIGNVLENISPQDKEKIAN